MPRKSKQTPTPTPARTSQPVPVIPRADRVKYVYIEERRKMESILGGGPFYFPPRIYDERSPSEWERLLAWCDAKKIDPETYIRIVFDLALPRLRTTHLEPCDLCSAQNFGAWQKYEPRQIEDLRARRARDTRAVRSAIELHHHQGHSWHDSYCHGISVGRYSFSGGAHNASPLSRYFLAKSLEPKCPQIVEIANLFFSDAAALYIQFPAAYSAAWESLVPPGFAEYVQAEYTRLMASFLREITPQQSRHNNDLPLR